MTTSKAFKNTFAAATIATLLFATPSFAQQGADGSILLIGNSFTRGIKAPLTALFRSAGQDVLVESRGPGGWTLQQHSRSGDTIRKIQSRRWDYVLLQEQSFGAGYWTYPPARTLDKIIKANGSETGFMMTWRDRGRTAASYDTLLGRVGGGFGYVPMAFELDGPLAPVGWAVRKLVEDGTPVNVWGRDGHHFDIPGEYLAACVIFTTITHTSPVGLEAPNSLSPLVAKYLQTLAADTVLGHESQWNLN